MSNPNDNNMHHFRGRAAVNLLQFLFHLQSLPRTLHEIYIECDDGGLYAKDGRHGRLLAVYDPHEAYE
jgi:hypothetical protein